MKKVGLVGTGFMGRMHSTVYNAIDTAELVGIYDKNPEAAAAHAEKFNCKAFDSYADLLEAVDVIDVCLPTHLHAQYSIEALNADKDVLCEKPMALNEDECKAMIAAEKASGRRLMIAHCIRFWPEYAHLKKLTDSGELGKLLSLNLTRYAAFPAWSSDNWLANEALCGGGAFDMHVHDTDFALYLMGEPKDVFSRGTVDPRGVSQIFTTLTYGDGAIAHLEGGWNLASGSPFKMAFRAIFESGTVIWDDCPMTVFRPDMDPEVVEFAKMAAAGGGNISDLGGYYLEIVHFIDRITSGEPFDVTDSSTALRSVELALQEIRQAKAAAV